MLFKPELINILIVDNLITEILELMVKRTEEIAKALDIELNLEQYLRLIIVMNHHNYSNEANSLQVD